ncbi:hypothetical protein [Chenggangzhangella methanolivorans]|uniref:Uncharacterized protein n=1 Tax=Chenggangzhangella methanolivorans TaxID=1437009 RepID=A0A9E6RA84_9HYPH|nr:hypothetical protein [Chenggangzhangella methanolivorans]QZN99502.1 hypothetical protein K6K41_22780 [Chenggangzhangella methanolivorans]
MPAGGEPPEATHYWIPYDSDTMAFSWKDFVAAQAQVASADGDLVEVEAYSWSEAPVPHRLVVENGAARFEPVEAEAAAHV